MAIQTKKLPENPAEWVEFISSIRDVDYCEHRNTFDIILMLQEAVERSESNMYCNLPVNLNDSLVNPQMIEMHPETFKQLYEDNVLGTVEEAIAEVLYTCFYEYGLIGVVPSPSDIQVDGYEHLDHLTRKDKQTHVEILTDCIDFLNSIHNSGFGMAGILNYAVGKMYSIVAPMRIDIDRYIKWYMDYYGYSNK